MEKKHPRVVVLSGKKARGKDTFAALLRTELNAAGYLGSVHMLALAEPLKAAAAAIFGLDDRQMNDQTAKEVVDERWGMTPREILQKLGTEVGRTFDQDVWVKSGIARINAGLEKDPDAVYIVTDCRFPNEITRTREAFDGRSIAVRIERTMPPTPFDGHPSETALDGRDDWDEVIHNDGDLRDLWTATREFISKYFKGAD